MSLILHYSSIKNLNYTKLFDPYTKLIHTSTQLFYKNIKYFKNTKT